MLILYAGDSPVGGPANYLLGILKFLKSEFVHIPPSSRLTLDWFKHHYDAIILSDFPRTQMGRGSEEAVLDQVSRGSGFLMVGGWGSFSGPFGNWRGSLIEKILPVSCQNTDDRVHFPAGALVFPKCSHSMFDLISFANPPVICGLNHFRLKKDSRVLLSVKEVLVSSRGRRGKYCLKLARREFPLLVISKDSSKKVAAFATDLAPHWCGGLVDWGRKRVKISIKNSISIEVGDGYVRLLSSLIRWLAR